MRISSAPCITNEPLSAVTSRRRGSYLPTFAQAEGRQTTGRGYLPPPPRHGGKGEFSCPIVTPPIQTARAPPKILPTIANRGCPPLRRRVASPGCGPYCTPRRSRPGSTLCRGGIAHDLPHSPIVTGGSGRHVRRCANAPPGRCLWPRRRRLGHAPPLDRRRRAAYRGRHPGGLGAALLRPLQAHVHPLRPVDRGAGGRDLRRDRPAVAPPTRIARLHPAGIGRTVRQESHGPGPPSALAVLEYRIHDAGACAPASGCMHAR